MGIVDRLGHDDTLLAFLAELADGASLDAEGEALARRTIEVGWKKLSRADRARLEAEVIAPYCCRCEDCGTEPGWPGMLQVYDTGLCDPCFADLMARDPRPATPWWSPEPPPPAEPDDELPDAVPGIAAVPGGEAAAAATVGS